MEMSDLEGEDWRVDILEDGYGGDPTTMRPTGEPLVFDWPGEGDDVFGQNIRGSQASINVYSDTDFEYSELFTSDGLEFKVNIYYDTTTLFWTGWINADTWSEPYQPTSYPVTITANDGLGLLKGFDFTDLSITSRATFSDIIYQTLGEIGFTAFTEFVNVYDIDMDSGTGDSPLDQSGAEPDLWEESTMYEALSDVLKTFNAGMTQQMGKMIIYRYKELSDVTMRGRIFTSATAKSSTTRTPLQSINRATTASDFDEVGGTLMIMPQVSLLNISQSYGVRESILDSWQFNYEDFSGSWDVSNWTETSTPDPRPIGLNSLTKGDNPGVYLHSVRTTSTGGANLNQSLAVKSSATDGTIVDFDWALLNNSGSEETLKVAVEIKIVEAGTGTPYYFTGSTWSVVATTLPVTGNILAIGVGEWTGWTNYRASVGTSKKGVITATLYCVVESGGASSVYTAYKNIKIQFSNSDGIILEGKEYEITNAVNGQIVDLAYNLGDGDTALTNALVMENGSIHQEYIDLTQVAAQFAANHSGDYAGITVTSSTNDIIFTADVAGTDFTGATTITNTVTDLDGSVVNTTANVVAVKRVDTVTLDTGTGGSADVLCNGVTTGATYNGSYTQTATDFVTNRAADYLPAVIVTSSGDDIIFTAAVAGVNFTGSTTITNSIPDLDGSVANTTANVVGVARVDTISLTGTSGTADILCDETTEEATFNFTPTTAWDTRGGSENDPIVELIGGEIGNQFSRPKHLLDLELLEQSNAFLDLVGNLQDDLNQFDGSDRVFIMNRANYDVRNRRWALGLNELI